MFKKLFKKEREIFYRTVTETLTKSKTVITQYTSIAAAVLQNYGLQILDAFNNNSTQLQSLVSSKVFAIISILCALLTIYLKITSKAIVVKKTHEEI